MKILFIVKSFLTHDRQNALCVERIAHFMKSDIQRIDYLSWEQVELGIKEENVYPIFETEAVSGLKGIERKIYKVFNTPLNSRSLVNKIYYKLEELERINHYNAIIAVINPAEGAEALYRFKKKHPDTNTILYEIDPNSNRYKYCTNIKHRIWKYKSIRWEKKIYSNFNCVIHMQSHEKHYKSKEFQSFAPKSIYLDIPNFEPINPLTITYSENCYRFIYGGAFYPILREPFYMFNLLKKINSVMPIRLDIYTGKSMRNALQKEERENDFVNIHNEVPESKLKEYIEESDILLSVGNRDSDFLPSKTLMCMSTCKPIIHFYSDDEDVSLKYYSYYPLVLLIDQRIDINDEIIHKTISFLESIPQSAAVDYKQLLLDLEKNTPQYTAKRLVDLIK